VDFIISRKLLELFDGTLRRTHTENLASHWSCRHADGEADTLHRQMEQQGDE
jgi:hypothetical protein